MKVNYNDLLHEFDSLNNEFSILTTLAEADVNWRAIPNSELEILKERLAAAKFLVEDLFNRLEKFPNV
jgi:hypothetical protein